MPLAFPESHARDARTMWITVIGCGYLGTAHAVCMANLGHQVLAVDVDAEKIRSLRLGRARFFEPCLPEALEQAVDSGALGFSGSLADTADFDDVHFVCVGTPPQEDSLATDISSVAAVIGELAPQLTRDCLVVGKSTVPVATASELAVALAGRIPVGVSVEIAWNPELVRKGSSPADALRPDRIVVGTTSARADAILRRVYAPILADGVRYISTDLQTAELAKVAANAFLATKFSFIHAMADLCEAAEADVVTLAEVLGGDERIDHRGLSAGLGFRDGCLPKDLRALATRGAELRIAESMRLLHEVDAINVGQRTRVVELAQELAGGSVADQNVAVLGAAFKPGIDDVRDSPTLAVAAALARADGCR
ncbi:MAG TPA: nucleotide sugar dehydrogenase [Streptosporangiaceae bacterium]